MSPPPVQPAVIELGEVGWPSEVAEQRRTPRSYRALGLLVAAVAALGVGAAAPAPRLPEPARVPMELGRDITFQDRWLFVTPLNSNVGPAGTVTAYRVPDGRRLWQARLRVAEGTLFVAPRALDDAVVLAWFGEDESARVEALDPRTGAPRWRRPGYWTGAVQRRPEGPLVLLRVEAGQYPPTIERITAVDLRTGAEAWTFTVPPGGQTYFPYEPGDLDVVLLAARSGELTVRDSLTGRVLATRVVRTPSEPDANAWLTIAGDLALVADENRDTLTAYGLPGLDRRWVSPLPEVLGGWLSAVRCGDLLCMQLGEMRTQGVDPRTGQVRWTGAWSLRDQFGATLLTAAASPRHEPHTPLVLRDANTGAALAELGSWQLAGDTASGARVLIRHDRHTLRVWVGLLEPGARDVRLLGALDDVVGDCQAAGTTLMCRDLDAAVTLFRLP